MRHWLHAFWLERARWWCGMQWHAYSDNCLAIHIFIYIYINQFIFHNKQGMICNIVSFGVLLLASSGKRFNEVTEGKVLDIMTLIYYLTIDRQSHCDCISVIVHDKCSTRAFTAWSPRAMDLPLVLAARPNNADSTGLSFWCVERDSQLRRSKLCNVFFFKPWALRLLKV